ncbi:MAG: hypothetical protein KAR31_08305 [Candidatus Omnitrophica bacterium]|nr:hypothetical protein [Candidatus Omnitrophota bacterium]
MKRLLWILAVICMVVPSALADTVIFKDGSALKGVIVHEMESKIRVERYVGAGFVTMEHSFDEIKEIIIDHEAIRRF